MVFFLFWGQSTFCYLCQIWANSRETGNGRALPVRSQAQAPAAPTEQLSFTLETLLATGRQILTQGIFPGPLPYFSTPTFPLSWSRMAWHKGTWWPLFVKEWYAPRSSQHMFDPYSFCLIVLGLVFHLLWGTDDIDYWIYGFLAALLIELGLEVVGNSQFVLKRIRNNSGTSGEYTGRVLSCLAWS